MSSSNQRHDDFSPVKEADTSLEIQLKDARKRAFDFQQSIKAARERDYSTIGALDEELAAASSPRQSPHKDSRGTNNAGNGTLSASSPLRSPNRQKLHLDTKYGSTSSSAGAAAGAGAVSYSGTGTSPKRSVHLASKPAVTPRTFKSSFRDVENNEQISILTRQNAHMAAEMEKLQQTVKGFVGQQRDTDRRLDDLAHEKELWRVRCLDMHNAVQAQATGTFGTGRAASFDDSIDVGSDEDEGGDEDGEERWHVRRDGDSGGESESGEEGMELRGESVLCASPMSQGMYTGDLTASERKLGSFNSSNGAAYRAVIAEASATADRMGGGIPGCLAAVAEDTPASPGSPLERAREAQAELEYYLSRGLDLDGEVASDGGEEDYEIEGEEEEEEDHGDEDADEDEGMPDGLSTESGAQGLRVSAEWHSEPTYGSAVFRESVESIGGGSGSGGSRGMGNLRVSLAARSPPRFSSGYVPSNQQGALDAGRFRAQHESLLDAQARRKEDHDSRRADQEALKVPRKRD
jgi:hypothetical protein